VTCFPRSATPPPDEIPRSLSFGSGIWIPSSPIVSPNLGALTSPLTSPPTSPRSPTSNSNPYFANVNGDRASTRRFSYSSDGDRDSCGNCTFIVPKDIAENHLGDSPNSPSIQDKALPPTPVLRTVQKISACGSTSSTDDDEESDIDLSPHEHTLHPRHTRLGTSPTPSQESNASENMQTYRHTSTHHHNLTYVTRHHPDSQSLYGRLRQSCIRALSCENLPRGSPSGPILFGDPIAGYTIAYLFRLPDPVARGRRRTYALQALSPDWRRASAAFTQVTRAFETIATNIVTLASSMLERDSSGSSTIVTSRPSTADLLRLSTPPPPPLSSSLPNSAPPQQSTTPPQGGGAVTQSQHKSRSSANSPVGSQRSGLTDVSSFLVASALDPEGYPRASRDMKREKPLTEIVGSERVFVDLHAKFCVVLYNLVAGLR
jgi:Vesicle coat protein involved in Golgi to plasma membrane transport